MMTIWPKKREKRGMSHERGFTLIEMIVSLAILAVVILIGMSSLLLISSANRKAQISRNLTDNIDFALDDITREARLAANYHCGLSGDTTMPADCPQTSSAGASSLAFTGLNDGTITTYQLGTENGRGVIQKSTGEGSYSNLTNSSVDVKSLTFYVSGAEKGDGFPRILVVMKAVVGVGTPQQTTINLQTTIAQRAQKQS